MHVCVARRECWAGVESLETEPAAGRFAGRDGRVEQLAALGLASAQDFGAFHDLQAPCTRRTAGYQDGSRCPGSWEDARAVKAAG